MTRTATPQQAHAKAAQIDEWRTRHGMRYDSFHRTTSAGIAADHREALEMDMARTMTPSHYETCAHRADFASASEHDRDCPGHEGAAIASDATRARTVAAIHALAEFLAQHPEYPTPVTILVTADVNDKRPEPTRVAEVLAWAKLVGASVSETLYSVHTRMPILESEPRITYTRSVWLRPPEPRRYT